MRKLLTGLVLLAGIPSSGWADKSPEIDLSTLSDDQLLHSIKQTPQTPFADPCRNAIPIYTEFDRRHPGALPILRALTFARMMCADSRGDPVETLTYLHELEEKYSTPGLDAIAIYLAARTNDGPLALARLTKLWRNDAFASETKEILGSAIRVIKLAGMEDELDALALEISHSPKFSTLSRDLRILFAGPALRAAAMAGDLSEVEDLLPLQNSPSAYTGMLEWREYEKAWPLIERTGGDHLVKVADSYIGESRARYAAMPADRDRFADLARSLHYGRHFAEVEALVGKWRRSQANLEKIEEGDAWAMNIEAYALDALGRRAEADDVFDRLAAYDPTQHVWEVNFAINRASRLVGQGRSEEGLAATVRARAIADKFGSPYAKMLVARDRTCALYGLGRPAEAASELEFLRKNSKESIDATAQALLCAHLDGEAVALLSHAMDDKVLRYDALSSFPGSEFSFFSTPSELPSVAKFIRDHPELLDKAHKLVRDIPERFVPEAHLERANSPKG